MPSTKRSSSLSRTRLEFASSKLSGRDDFDLVVDFDRDRSRRREKVRDSGLLLINEEGVLVPARGIGDVDASRAGVATARVEDDGGGAGEADGSREGAAEARVGGAYNRELTMSMGPTLRKRGTGNRNQWC